MLGPGSLSGLSFHHLYNAAPSRVRYQWSDYTRAEWEEVRLALIAFTDQKGEELIIHEQAVRYLEYRSRISQEKMQEEADQEKMVPPPDALRRLGRFEYVELDNFSSHNCTPAKDIPEFDIDDPLEYEVIANYVRPDLRLSRDEMWQAKAKMLHYVARDGIWPKEHIDNISTFFDRVYDHRGINFPIDYRNQKFVRYASKKWREWFDALEKGDEEFDITVIDEDLIRTIKEEILEEKAERTRNMLEIWAQAEAKLKEMGYPKKCPRLELPPRKYHYRPRPDELPSISK